MGLLKKCDTRNHLSDSRNENQRSTRSNRHGVKADFSVLEPERSVAKLSFAEDFLLEHSVSGMQFRKVGIAANPAISSNDRSESCQYLGFPS